MSSRTNETCKKLPISNQIFKIKQNNRWSTTSKQTKQQDGVVSFRGNLLEVACSANSYSLCHAVPG